VSTSIVVTPAYVQSLLPPLLAWLYPYLPFMHGLEIGDVAAFCAADPPTWSVPTGPQIFDFITSGNLANYNLVETFIENVTRAYLWYNLCQCASVATPAPPTPPTAPTNLPAVNPPSVGITVGTCLSRQISGLSIPNGDASIYLEVSDLLFPAGATFTPSSGTGFGLTQARVMDGLQLSFVRFTWIPDSGTVDVISVPRFYNAAHTANAGGSVYHSVDSNPFTLVLPDPASGGTGLSIGIMMGMSGVHAATTGSLLMEAWCGGSTPTTPATACCPPDPSLLARLIRLEQLLTLIQRNDVPFAYVPGPTHAGLTGDGTLTIPTCLGILVTVTTNPPYSGVLLGSPNEVFDIGWFSWGTADGFDLRVRIHKLSQLSFPNKAAQFTRIGYSLNPGVVVSIQELYAEQ
jgi:hypothetical protein